MALEASKDAASERFQLFFLGMDVLVCVLNLFLYIANVQETDSNDHGILNMS